MKRCLGEDGYDVTVMADGGITLTVPPAQAAAFERAQNDCKERLGFNAPVEVSDEEYSALFDRRLALKECLEAEGFRITEPPSRQTFIATQGRWQPYEDLSAEPIERQRALGQRCPQV
jgi:hypothetical protein